MPELKGKNVLVTGASGLVGSNLIRRLLNEDCFIRAVYHKNKPKIIDKRIEYINADLTVSHDCDKVVKDVEYVFHCAAVSAGAAMLEKNPLIFVTPNLVMNTFMLDSAYKAGVQKFVYISSTTGYPDIGNRLLREEDMFIGEPYDKYYLIGSIKRSSEILCRIYSEKIKSNMLTIVLRPTNIYGPYDDFNFETCHVLPALIRKVVERHEPLEVWGTGDDLRDFIYVDDVIDAMLLAVGKMHNYLPLNIGYGKSYSVKEILNVILDADNYKNVNIVFNSNKPTTIPVRLFDVSKAKKHLGFEPKVSIEQGVLNTVNWYKTRREK